MRKSRQDGSDFLTLSDHLQDLQNYKTPWKRLVADVMRVSSASPTPCRSPLTKLPPNSRNKPMLPAWKWRKIEEKLRAQYKIGPYELALKMNASYPTLKNWRRNGISLDKYGARLEELGILIPDK